MTIVGALALAPAASAKVIVGTGGDDTLAGTDERDFIYGRSGNDTMAGNGASDFLFGHRGDDPVSGDAGWDAAGWLPRPAITKAITAITRLSAHVTRKLAALPSASSRKNVTTIQPVTAPSVFTP